MKIDWKRKLTSRKFWLAVVELVAGLMMAFKVDGTTIETVSGCIMAAAAVIAYTIGEGLADAANGTYSVEQIGKHEPLYGEMIEDKE